MTVELAASVEEQLRALASKQGREIGVLVEEAVRRYLEFAAIADVEPGEVAETQMALMGELDGIPEGFPVLGIAVEPASQSGSPRQRSSRRRRRT